MELHDNVSQMDLTDICRAFHPNTKERIFICSWNFLRKWPHIRAQNKSQQMQESWNNTLYPTWTKGLKWMSTTIEAVEIMQTNPNNMQNKPNNSWMKTGPRQKLRKK